MYRFKTKISKNGIMYYIRIPPIYSNNIKNGSYVVAKIILSENPYSEPIIIPLVRIVARLGKYKIVTLPTKMTKIWTILHRKKVLVELTPVANIDTLEKVAKDVIEKIINL
jgi:hypothetical protein